MSHKDKGKLDCDQRKKEPLLIGRQKGTDQTVQMPINAQSGQCRLSPIYIVFYKNFCALKTQESWFISMSSTFCLIQGPHELFLKSETNVLFSLCKWVAAVEKQPFVTVNLEIFGEFYFRV